MTCSALLLDDAALAQVTGGTLLPGDIGPQGPFAPGPAILPQTPLVAPIVKTPALDGQD